MTRQAGSRTKQAAFTVVELLVVIGIIGVLMAILLPAVGAAREAARKANCLANMRSIAQASQVYETNRQYLPPSRYFFPSGNNTYFPDNYTTKTNALHWVHALLVELDQKQLSDQLANDAAAGNGSPVGMLAVCTGVTTIKSLFCPSDVSEQSRARRLSYACNAGRENGENSMGLPFDHPANGVFDDRMKGRMDSHPIYRTTRADITDGLSQTIAFAENIDLVTWESAQQEFEFAVIWEPSQTHPLGLNRQMSQSGGNSNTYARPSSQHSGVFCVAFCDGSARFLNDSISYETYAKLMTSNGAKIKAPGTNNAEAAAIRAWQSTPIQGEF